MIKISTFKFYKTAYIVSDTLRVRCMGKRNIFCTFIAESNGRILKICKAKVKPETTLACFYCTCSEY